jgi:dTDP-4-amino-4,6-dideoxygalactose transaminase
MAMIPFNEPVVIGDEKEYLNQVFLNKKFSGKGKFTKEAQSELLSLLEDPSSQCLLTTSCTDALEMAAILSGIGAGDEVIMPSFTFVSSANAFVLRGAKVRFVDVETQSMNLDLAAVRKAITTQTKVVLIVHYAGMSCDMEELQKICRENKLILIEDAAQALLSSFRGKPLGTFGDMACFSFHDTKNIHCGEGGALIVNNPAYFERAEIVIEKGTDRSKFLNGIIDKYTWQDIGSSFLLSELNAAFLVPQLKNAIKITERRLAIWNEYRKNLSALKYVQPIEGVTHNAHLFAIICPDSTSRTHFIAHMKEHEVQVVPHYVPLHTSPAGKRFGDFSGEDKNTTSISERLIRLPLFYSMTDEQVRKVIEAVLSFNF